MLKTDTFSHFLRPPTPLRQVLNSKYGCTLGQNVVNDAKSKPY